MRAGRIMSYGAALLLSAGANLAFRHGKQSSNLDSLVSEFAHRVTSCNPDEVDKVVEAALSKVRTLLGAGNVCWYVNDERRPYLEKVFSYTAPGGAVSLARIDKREIAYTESVLTNSKTMWIESAEVLPSDAVADRRFLQEHKLEGVLIAASNQAKGQRGILVASFIPKQLQCSALDAEKLRLFSDLLLKTVQRRRIHALLRSSENRFRCLAQNAPIGIALADLQGKLVYVNPALCSLLDCSQAKLLRMRWSDLSPAGASREELFSVKLQRREIDRYTVEKLFRRDDGVEIWGRVDVALIPEGKQGSPLVVAMVEDITSKKRAEVELESARTELQELARRLIHAQEEERHRISRDLHDDIGQRLSLLAIELDSFADDCAKAGLEEEANRALVIKSLADNVVTDVHQMSHQLHSVKLQHLGLKSAIQELLRKMETQNQLAIHFEGSGSDCLLSHDGALCLFRVTQEALNNIIHHSGASEAMVKLEISSTLATLSVCDHGAGFDAAQANTGLGLISMRERTRMAGGELSIESQKGAGTVITATLPISTKQSESHALPQAI